MHGAASSVCKMCESGSLGLLCDDARKPLSAIDDLVRLCAAFRLDTQVLASAEFWLFLQARVIYAKC